jgi:uncharacterized protein YbjQ (UPF0145 family)
MLCPKCGYENPDTAKNCANCKVNLEWANANRDELKSQFQKEESLREEENRILENMGTMLLVTTPTIENHPIKTYLGIVSSEIVLGTGLFSELNAVASDWFGVRSSEFERKMKNARQSSLLELKKEAANLGANAVVSVRLDYETVGSLFMLYTSGTAVFIE